LNSETPSSDLLQRGIVGAWDKRGAGEEKEEMTVGYDSSPGLECRFEVLSSDLGFTSPPAQASVKSPLPGVLGMEILILSIPPKEEAG